MIALVPFLAAVGLVFVEQPIDGILVSSGDVIWSSTRYGDFDGDRINDVITRTSVAFQRDGQFPRNQQTPLPAFGNLAVADIWNGEIFVLLQDRIEVLRWSNTEWQRTLSQPIAWPAIAIQPGEDVPSEGASPGVIRFERFLSDLDGDGKPEIIRAAPDGLHVYSKQNLFYEARTIWSIFQRPLASVSTQALWPQSTRAVQLPTLGAVGSVDLVGNEVSVFRVESLDNLYQRIRKNVYSFDTANNFTLSTEPVRVQTAEAIDCLAVRLNDDDVIDLLRVRVAGETAPPLTTPIVETRISTNAGKSFYTVRSYGPPPVDVLTDYNKDGRVDLISETKRLVEGGIRETLVRGLTRKEVDLDVEVRLQDAESAFPTKPTITHKFIIELDKPPANRSRMFSSFLNGTLFSLRGDCDGDGLCDAVVRDRPNRLAIRTGQLSGISSNPTATIPIETEWPFTLADIDGDGRSDIVLSSDGYNATVYLSRDAVK